MTALVDLRGGSHVAVVAHSDTSATAVYTVPTNETAQLVTLLVTHAGSDSAILVEFVQSRSSTTFEIWREAAPGANTSVAIDLSGFALRAGDRIDVTANATTTSALIYSAVRLGDAGPTK